MTDKLDPPALTQASDAAETDLARRLARYRRRVEAEGRPRSVKLIDRAIEDAGKKARDAADVDQRASPRRGRQSTGA
jgi:hypothetical protein